MSGKKTKQMKRTIEKQVKREADRHADGLAREIKEWQVTENVRLRRKIFFVGALNVVLVFAVIWLLVVVFKPPIH